MRKRVSLSFLSRQPELVFFLSKIGLSLSKILPLDYFSPKISRILRRIMMN